MVIKCKMCGGDLEFVEGSTVCECEFCGTRQTVPTDNSEKKATLFNRANRLRMNAEFDKASSIYESIVAEFPEEAEAYWGLCLCAYGIEYVDDPATGEKKPTCHRTLPVSIMEDSNFEQACDNADAIARRVYRDEAKEIDRIQKDILAIVSREEPYDVFICYKETAEEGGRTEDSVLAQDIYDTMSGKGLKVFFARITLEDKLGQQYEPYIYAALSSAKVMIAVGTKFEYYDAVWVKNEWMRFLSMMKTDKSKTLIPCFKNLDAYDIPKEFRQLQAQDMGKLGWLQDLTRGVLKLCGKESVPVVQARVSGYTDETASLIRRAELFIQDREWAKADEYIDRILDKNPENGTAYLMRLLTKNKCEDDNQLIMLGINLAEDRDYQKAMRFSSGQIRDRIDHIVNTISLRTARNELVGLLEQRAVVLQRKDKIYCQASALLDSDSLSVENLMECRSELRTINKYPGAKELIQRCESLAKDQLRNELEQADSIEMIQNVRNRIMDYCHVSGFGLLFENCRERELLLLHNELEKADTLESVNAICQTSRDCLDMDMQASFEGECIEKKKTLLHNELEKANTTDQIRDALYGANSMKEQDTDFHSSFVSECKEKVKTLLHNIVENANSTIQLCLTLEKNQRSISEILDIDEHLAFIDKSLPKFYRLRVKDVQNLRLYIERYTEYQRSALQLQHAQSARAKAVKEVNRLNQEMGQLRGLFSGKRRAEIETLLRKAKDRIQTEEANCAKAEADLERLSASSSGSMVNSGNVLQDKSWTEDEFVDIEKMAQQELNIPCSGKNPCTTIGGTIVFGTKPLENGGLILKYIDHWDGTEHPKPDLEEIRRIADTLPILWKILDYDETNQRILLISLLGIKHMGYTMEKDGKDPNRTDDKLSWSNSNLRRWLNEEFLKSAFNADEQRAIVETDVNDPLNQDGQGTDVGCHARDKVFLLSCTEVERLLPVAKARKCMTIYDMRSRLESFDDGDHRWLLRSVDNHSKTTPAVYMVDEEGRINNNFYTSYGWVRPAIWVDINALPL